MIDQSANLSKVHASFNDGYPRPVGALKPKSSSLYPRPVMFILSLEISPKQLLYSIVGYPPAKTHSIFIWFPRGRFGHPLNAVTLQTLTGDWEATDTLAD